MATVMTVELEEPGQYGRIVRDADGGVERIVETKHPESVPPEILASKEINTGTYCFHGPTFAAALGRITNENEAGEYYLGDVLPLMRSDGHRIAAHVATDPNVNLGVNNRADLAQVEAEARRRINEAHMLAGVTVTDPSSTWIDADVEIGQDATIEPGTALRGETRIGDGATIGPHTTIVSSSVGANTHRPALAPRRRERRRRLQRRPLLLPAPGREPRRRLEGGHLRRDQELRDRPRREGPASRVHRRRRRRRGRQRRRGVHHRELRRQGQAPHEDRGRCANRGQQLASSRRWRSARALTLAPVQ